VLAAAGHHPYARLTTDGDGPVAGYRRYGALAWTGPGPWGPVACAVGDATAAVRLLADLAAAQALGGGRWLHLPRVDPAELPAAWAGTVRDHWDFRWSHRPPPLQPDEERVVALTDADAPSVAELLDRAFPDTTTRPGDPRVRAWYGIREGGRLVAAGGDRGRGDVGFLAGLAVAPEARGRGLGAALTAAMTRRLFTTYDCVALGVVADHAGTIRLYERLGFTDALPRTTIGPPPPDHGRMHAV
jgi:GNAT superfamily N-acetyltransferase